MGKFIKSIVAGVLALSMATWGVPVWAAIEETSSIPVNVPIGTVGSYSISASVSGDGSLDFTTSTVSTSDPWRIADDYIDIGFSAPTNTTWGVRIVTDNAMDLLGLTRDLTGTNYLFVDADGDGEYDSGETIVSEQSTDTDGDGTDDYYYIEYGGVTIAGVMSDSTGTHRYYSGLIDSSTADNPTMRAPLAFMVDGYDTTGAATTPSVPTTAPPVDEDHGGSSEVGEWDDPWYWLGDKSNDEYDDLVDTDNDGTADDIAGHLNVLYYVGGYITPNYSLIAYGTPYGRYVGRPGPGETANDGAVNSRPLADIGTPSSTNPWSIYVYLCGKFTNTDWATSGEPDFVLPAGSYSTSISLELFSE